LKNYKVTVNGQSFTVIVEELNQQQTAKANTLSAPVEAAKPASAASHRQNEPSGKVLGAGEIVESPMPGSIIAVSVKPGNAVKEGEVLLILEAMKMENEITAPQSGTVREVHVKIGDTVDTGEPLVTIS
jgi:biotin carboxyl carrier protein